MTIPNLMLTTGLYCCLTTVVAQPLPSPLALRPTSPLGHAMPGERTARAADVIHFCGESLPFDQPTIAERWTRTISRQAALAGTLTRLKRRASVVFPLIEPILKKHRIPADFKYLPLLESAVTNRAVSRQGAAGFWQLMPQTAQSLGLHVAHGHDERFNLQKATHAACRYLNRLYDELGSWMLVATAYNAGPNYIGQLNRQYPDQHPMALPYRNPETKAYLFQAVAVKELLTRPQAYRSYLSDRHLLALSDASTPVSAAERLAILASFDLNEAAVDRATPGRATAGQWGAGCLAFVADSTTTVVLLTDDELAQSPSEPVGKTTASEPTASEPTASSPDRPRTDTTGATAVRLLTRCLSEGPLTEGQLCVFQVIQPVTINERSFAVGDLIHAHIEVIDAGSGRVFLRTDRLLTARTQETIPIRLVATGQPRQPGVPLRARLENWQLTWEAL